MSAPDSPHDDVAAMIRAANAIQPCCRVDDGTAKTVREWEALHAQKQRHTRFAGQWNHLLMLWYRHRNKP